MWTSSSPSKPATTSNMAEVKSPVKKAKTSHTDVFMSIFPEHIDNIASRLKNHEYRKYLLPSSVQRIWFYTTAPVSSVHYVARISGGKVPGQVPEDGGIGNEDFNAGKKVSKYGYEILELWQLVEPISLEHAKLKGYLNGPPQKYCWVSLAVIEDYPLDKQINIFRTGAEIPAEPKTISDFFGPRALNT